MPALVTRPESSGGRDRKIRLQQLVQSTGPSGFPIESWVDLATVWANKLDSPLFFNRESYFNNQELASYETTWTIPYLESMDPELVDVPARRRVIVKDRVHDIIAAGEVGRRMGIQMFCTSGGLLSEDQPPGPPLTQGAP